MKILLLSDMHADCKYINQLDTQFQNADIVLFAGDFAAFSKPETGKPALDLLCSKHDNIISVLGNCDPPDFLHEIEKKDISCQNQLCFQEGLIFCGSGGGSKFTGTTPNEREDSDLVGDLDCAKKILHDINENNLVLICHNPIKDTKTDAVSPTVHVGSPLLRQFIEEVQPLLVVCGHIHESAGIDKIKNTTIVNPGPLCEGHYATCKIEKVSNLWQISDCTLF